MDMRERCLSKIDRSDDPEACWPWRGKRDSKGYGAFYITPRKLIQAHRAAYQFLVEPIAEGMKVLHTCDNPPCCNPAHLFQGTAADNVMDMIKKGRAGFQIPHRGAFYDWPQRRKPDEPLREGQIPRGEGNGKAKLTDEDVREIRALKSAGVPAKIIAQRFGITPTNVRVIARGAGWKHVT